MCRRGWCRGCAAHALLTPARRTSTLAGPLSHLSPPSYSPAAALAALLYPYPYPPGPASPQYVNEPRLYLSPSTSEHTATDSGIATRQIDGAVGQYVLPLMPALFQDEDPMPL